MCADKNSSGCHLAKHGIENRPVASALNRINPYEDTVNSHELVTNFLAKIVVIDRRLGVYPFGGEGSEQVRQPVIFSCCVPPYLITTRVKNRDPSAAILRHRFLFPEIDVVSLSASQIDFVLTKLVGIWSCRLACSVDLASR